MWISSSTVVGGGVRGKGVGIALGIMIQAGVTINTLHLFMVKCLHIGGMTIGGINGKGINGTTNEYLTIKFNGTGTNGNMTNIGRSKTLGTSKICGANRTPKDSIKRYRNNTSTNSLSLNMEKIIKRIIKKVMEKVMESRMTKAYPTMERLPKGNWSPNLSMA
jgi:hypothetical protein